jgi:peptidyl-prolyl cis-trans isomerase C
MNVEIMKYVKLFAVIVLNLCLITQVLGEETNKKSVTSNVDGKAENLGLKVLATAPGNNKLTAADILSEANKMPVEVRLEFLKKPEAMQQVVRNLMVRRLLAQEAEKEKLDKDGIVKAALQVAKERVLSDARIRVLDEANSPDGKALEAYARNSYQANLEKFKLPAQTRASHILIEKKNEESIKRAEELITKIKTGAKFEELAKEHSKDPGSAARGGDLGFFGEGRMVKPFEDALKALNKPGDISQPVETQFGFHIIRLDERKAASTMTFDEVKKQLLIDAKAEILSQKRASKVAEMESKIKFDRASIEQLSKEASQIFNPQ